MDSLTRQETLKVLSSMGIELPPFTKLPDDALLSRLDQAIKSCQSLPDILPSPSSATLKISALTDWPSGRLGKVMDAMYRANLEEAFEMTALRRRIGAREELFVDVFMDLRQTIVGLGKSWDDGALCCVVQDPAQEEAAINIRMLSVKRINDKTPVMVLLYSSVTKANPQAGVDWFSEKINTCPRDAHGQVRMTNTSATLLEQKLLLRVLEFNSKYVPSGFKPRKTPAERDFKVSFIFPAGPLSFEALGKLNLDPGCAICGDKAARRCSACQSISYCGPECQRQDWPNHKQSCKSLKGGTWYTIRISNCLPGLEGMYMTTLNRLDSTSSPGGGIKQAENTEAPPNIHGSRVFLIKLQYAQMQVDGRPELQGVLPKHMLIYDRRKSVQGYLVETSNASIFREFEREIRGPRGGPRAVKMYRWARRVSDWELSVCIDRMPLEVIKW